jgi:hypothetical protein
MWVARAVSAPVRHAPLIAHFLTQAAHRLIALALWVLAARIALSFFSYEARIATLLPWTLILLNSALVCAFAGYWLARVTRGQTGEPRSLVTPTLILIALTAAWMILDLAVAS